MLLFFRVVLVPFVVPFLPPIFLFLELELDHIVRVGQIANLFTLSLRHHHVAHDAACQRWMAAAYLQELCDVPTAILEPSHIVRDQVQIGAPIALD